MIKMLQPEFQEKANKVLLVLADCVLQESSTAAHIRTAHLSNMFGWNCVCNWNRQIQNEQSSPNPPATSGECPETRLLSECQRISSAPTTGRVLKWQIYLRVLTKYPTLLLNFSMQPFRLDYSFFHQLWQWGQPWNRCVMTNTAKTNPYSIKMRTNSVFSWWTASCRRVPQSRTFLVLTSTSINQSIN